ncbi:MAG: GNAT family N-acetyltransferase [Clostridia bacterium]|nr:GNAT family N-acetyltransferase [Clostridia bacterium]
MDKKVNCMEETIKKYFRYVRKATPDDVSRMAEIYVFNNRMEYFPVFNNVNFSFGELQVLSYANTLKSSMPVHTYVYDDGVIKGFVIVDGEEISKLHIEYFFQNQGIGSVLLEYAIRFCNGKFLWVLKKNKRATKFYESKGLIYSGEKNVLYGLNGHTEFVIKMQVKGDD